MHLQEVLHLLFWDTRTGAPKKGMAMRSEVVAMIASEKFSRSVSPEMKRFLEEFAQPASLHSVDEVTRKTLEEMRREYERNTKIPADEFRAYTVLKTSAGKAWEEARKASDFSLFHPYLEEMIAYNKRFIACWGYEGHRYNALLDLHDPGMTVELLDDVFGRLKEALIPFIQRILQTKRKPDRQLWGQPFPKEKQKDFHVYMLRELGYDFESGRLDETVHPFAIPVNRHDVRITTRFDEQDFLTGLFATIHECGHALYDQNISPELTGTPLYDGASDGMHESQSLFWEKIVGRHQGFWKHYYPKLQASHPELFHDIGLEEFYLAMHHVEPGYIRLEADELTYPLHIIIRYELEKGLFQDEIEAKDLPRLWNQKMQEYLRILPPDDARGVLQDMHWSAGMFGQFPSYALGYLYAAQFWHAMKRDLPAFDELVGSGSFDPIRRWLATNIHEHGKMKSPREILMDATGEELNPEYLLRYFDEKYRSLYF